MKHDDIRKVHSIIGVLGITGLVFLMLVSIAGAAPFAYITNYNSNTVTVIDTATNTVTSTVTVGYIPQGIAATPDGKKVYVANSGYVEHPDSSVSVIDTATNTVIKTINVEPHPTHVAVSPDGKKAYVVSTQSGGISIIDTATDTVTSTLSGFNYPIGVAITPDGSKVYVSEQHDVSVIDTATNTVTTTINTEVGPSEIVVNPEGTKVYVAHPAKFIISVIDTKSNTVTNTILYNNDINSPYGITINPTGTKLYATHHASNIVSVTDISTNTVTATVNVGNQPQEVAVSSDGTKVYVANQDSGTISVIDVSTNDVTTINAGGSPFGVVITPAQKLTTPTITWDTPMDIIAGTSLSSTQLNAQAKHPTTGETITGVFTYKADGNSIDVGTVLNVGTHPLHVDFTPANTANYNITSKDVTINVLKVTPTITWDNPTDITAGIALSSTQLNAIASVPGTFLYTPPLGTILAVGTHTLHVDFTPADTATYNTTSKNVQINVVAAPLKTPTLTWSNPADITYGTALSSTQLNAVATDPVTQATVPGTFVYTPKSGFILREGQQQTLSVVFTPTDTTTYNTASKDVTINVNAATPPQKTTPTVTWSNPADIVSGTPLSSTQLNAVASVPGTFTYTPSSGTVLNAGTQTLKVDFTPTDTVNYNSVSQTVTINILKATPTVTWNNPADIRDKTALSGTQLNAVASVPGTFTYTPPAGTILNAGTQTLKVDFTPSDTANYNSVSKTVTIDVLSNNGNGNNGNGNNGNGNNGNGHNKNK